MATDDTDYQTSNSDFTTPRYSISHAVARLGGEPAAPTIRTYIKDGLIVPKPFQDSQGRLLFSDRDIEAVRKVHEMRARKWGKTVRRVTSTHMG
jgi:MerR HTH family regulatory protein